MNSISVFREGKIDGKPFHIFNFLSQTSSSSSSASLEPRFICPYSRFMKDPNNNDDMLPYYASPHFPITKINNDGDDNEDEETCKLPVLPIFWCNNKNPNEAEFSCGGCARSEIGATYYICLGCKRQFHKECVETPLEIQNPSFPYLSFHLYHSPHNTTAGKIFSRFRDGRSCISCRLEICYMFYHCPTNKVSMHPLCAMKQIPILIDHLKRHPHTLTFFPKQASLLCDVCGLVQESFPTYVCLRCIFVVHQDCIYLPFVIKISRHHHRISFIYSLPSGNWFCGVCRQKVDNRFGAYSCNRCSDYFVHSRCAVRKDLWDGKELEGVPEEPEIVVDPFKTIADGIILHFTHGHHLKLEVSKVYNEYTICQACVLPVYEGNYYSCLDQCDFVLHELCASAPRKKHHALHAHPLMLQANSGSEEHYYECNACERLSCGFVYQAGYYNVDLRCASISEPFEYEGHEHPLFLSLDPTQEREATCRICRSTYEYIRKLSCIECNYVICFRCATLPYKAKYKHDEHFLTFHEGKEGIDLYDWCEICERKLEYSSADGYYECDKCCTTLHVRCLLGETPYLMKPGQVIEEFEKEVHILSNNTQSRPSCRMCHRLCPQKVVFKWKDKTYCSFRCFYYIAEDDESKPLKEVISVEEIRPKPRKNLSTSFRVHNKVDDNDGWWIVEVTGRRGNMYSV